MLKSLAGIGATTFAVGVGSAQKSNPTSIEGANFDPKDKKEIGTFVDNQFKFSKEAGKEEIRDERATIEKNLSNKQKDAVADFISNHLKVTTESNLESEPISPDLVDTHDTGTPSVNAGWSLARFSHSINVDIEVRGIGHDAYDFYHELQWYADPARNRVKNATHTASGDGNWYVVVSWHFIEITSSSLTYHPNNRYVDAKAVGKFNEVVFGSKTGRYPRIDLMGDSHGYGNITYTRPK